MKENQLFILFAFSLVWTRLGRALPLNGRTNRPVTFSRNLLSLDSNEDEPSAEDQALLDSCIRAAITKFKSDLARATKVGCQPTLLRPFRFSSKSLMLMLLPFFILKTGSDDVQNWKTKPKPGAVAKIPNSHSWSGVRRAGDGQTSAATAAASKAASTPTTPGLPAPNVSSTSIVSASSKKPTTETSVQATLPAVVEEKPTSKLPVSLLKNRPFKCRPRHPYKNIPLQHWRNQPSICNQFKQWKMRQSSDLSKVSVRSVWSRILHAVFTMPGVTRADLSFGRCGSASFWYRNSLLDSYSNFPLRQWCGKATNDFRHADSLSNVNAII